jgi:rhodanese-related sulfurtransferase
MRVLVMDNQENVAKSADEMRQDVTSAAENAADSAKEMGQQTLDAAGNAAEAAKEKGQQTLDAVGNAADSAKDKLTNSLSHQDDAVEGAKKAVTAPLPKAPSLHEQASVRELKARLEWGEPALTILDVRDRDSFNKGHITGAMPMSSDQLVDPVQGLSFKRDIYVYGASDAETSQAAQQLRSAGFENVAELKGGLNAWKAIGGQTDGSEETVTQLTPGAFNVVARLAQHRELQRKAKAV